MGVLVMNALGSMEAIGMDFKIETLLQALQGKSSLWGGYVVSILGAVMMLASLIKIAKAFFSDRAQVNWVLSISGIVLGGLLFAAGWGMLQSMSTGIANEIFQYGGG